MEEDGGVGEAVASVGEVNMPVAWDNTAHGQRVGPDEVVRVDVFVHDLEPNQSQLREVDNHLEGLFPLGVESWG